MVQHVAVWFVTAGAPVRRSGCLSDEALISPKKVLRMMLRTAPIQGDAEVVEIPPMLLRRAVHDLPSGLRTVSEL
jgi:hypothetical protein